jgi:hypothetical protein
MSRRKDLRAKREFREKWVEDPSWEWVTMEDLTLTTEKQFRRKLAKRKAKGSEDKTEAAGRMVNCTLAVALVRLVHLISA